jgi:hypothetical protein
MWKVGRTLVCSTFLLLVGCGGGEGEGRAADRAALVDSPSLAGVVARDCAALAETERMPVLCPSWLPSVRSWPDRYDGYSLSQRDFERNRCRYLTQMGYRGPGAGGRVPFHVLFGGTCGQLPLTVRDGRWPSRLPARAHEDLYARYLRLPTGTWAPGRARPRVNRPRVVGRATVAGKPALLLQLDRHPRGGIHGGHYAIVWNADGAGHALSLHYDRGDAGGRGSRPRPSDRRALIDAAEGMVVVPKPVESS